MSQISNKFLDPAIFFDSNFALHDNVDNTKTLKFELTNIAASTTRTITVPDANINLATTTSGSFANNTLGNLSSPTAVNQNLVADTSVTRDLGTSSNYWSNLYVNNARANNGVLTNQYFNSTGLNVLLATSNGGPDSVTYGVNLNNPGATDNIGIYSTDSAVVNASATPSVGILTGNKTAGTGNSGAIKLRVGTSAGGTRGKIQFQNGSEGTIGHVWTESATDGSGGWAVAATSNITSQTSQTTTYSILSTDSLVLLNATSAGFTATLPTAVGSTGKVYYLKKTDSTFNVVTIATTSSQTIDGVVGTTLNTQNEILTITSDGANWQIIQRRWPTGWISYTPTGAWTGTYTGIYRRIGDSIECQGKIVLSGAPTGGASLSIPTGLTIDTAKVLTQSIEDPFGYGKANDQGVNSYPLCVGYATTTVVSITAMLASGTYAADGASPVNATTPFSFGNTDGIQCRFIVPISGWKG